MIFNKKNKKHWEEHCRLSKIVERQKDKLEKHKEMYDFEVDVQGFLDGKNYLNELEPAKKKELLELASKIHNNKALKTVIDNQINNHAGHSMMQAKTSEIIMFDRASISALRLLKDEFEKLDNLYKELTSPDEEFDKFKGI